MCLLLAPVLWGWSWRTVLSGLRPEVQRLVTCAKCGGGKWVECTATSVVGLSGVIHKVAGHFYFLISALAQQIFALNMCWVLCRPRLGSSDPWVHATRVLIGLMGKRNQEQVLGKLGTSAHCLPVSECGGQLEMQSSLSWACLEPRSGVWVFHHRGTLDHRYQLWLVSRKSGVI